jgi:cardiolipin synthase
MTARVDTRRPSAEATIRLFAQQTLSRAAGAPLTGGNAVELLIDARANFDAWLVAVRQAQRCVLVENYIFADDAVARELRDALVERAAAGVQVCVIRDWLGCIGQSRDTFWRALRAAGGEVRTYNPLHLARPFGWLSRDHRKLLVVDATVGFVSGVCVSGTWLGDPARGIPPWRDTGVSIRGPALESLTRAFAESWARLGDALRDDVRARSTEIPPAGDVHLRVVATLPSTTGLYRLEQMIAAMAQRYLWLTDAYFVGTASYVQSLVSAARAGVDVRLLVPGASDLPGVGALSRAGYRTLLEAGVRVYEWNGSMLHAKTGVADGRWGRVGSSNLNMASWMGNCEVDVVVEDEGFACRLAAQYEDDLRGATEIVLAGGAVNAAGGGKERRAPRGAGSGRAAASALRLANTVGAAIADRRVLGQAEGRILLAGALVLSALGAIAIVWPRVLAWPLGALAVWSALGLFYRYATVSR